MGQAQFKIWSNKSSPRLGRSDPNSKQYQIISTKINIYKVKKKMQRWVWIGDPIDDLFHYFLIIIIIIITFTCWMWKMKNKDKDAMATRTWRRI